MDYYMQAASDYGEMDEGFKEALGSIATKSKSAASGLGQVASNVGDTMTNAVGKAVHSYMDGVRNQASEKLGQFKQGAIDGASKYGKKVAIGAGALYGGKKLVDMATDIHAARAKARINARAAYNSAYNTEAAKYRARHDEEDRYAHMQKVKQMKEQAAREKALRKQQAMTANAQKQLPAQSQQTTPTPQ